MANDTREWHVPSDAPTTLSLRIAPEEPEPIVLSMNAKDAPVKAGVRLTIDQAAILEHQLDEYLDELEDRPQVRTQEREQTDHDDSRGVY